MYENREGNFEKGTHEQAPEGSENLSHVAVWLGGGRGGAGRAFWQRDQPVQRP